MLHIRIIQIIITFLLLLLPTILLSINYNAEDVLNSKATSYQMNHAGDTFLHYKMGEKGFIEWEIDIQKEQRYAIDLIYSVYAEKAVPLSIIIDKQKIADIYLLPTPSSNIWTTSKSVDKFLSVGVHHIKIIAQDINYDLAIKSIHLKKSNKHEDTQYIEENITTDKPLNNTINSNVSETISTSSQNRVPIILDVDMMTDCDDAAAIGVAHALEDNGEAEIWGMALSAHDYRHYNGNTVSAVNYYYNNNFDIPIGAWYSLVDSHGEISNPMKQNFRFDNTGNTIMHKRVKNQHQNDNKLNYQREKSLNMYTRLLQKAKNEHKKVKIIVLGTNFNIERLLQERRDLVSQTVEEMVFSLPMTDAQMNGHAHCGVNSCSRPEVWNQGHNEAKKATDYVFNHMPSNILITVTGDEKYDQHKSSICDLG